MHLTGAHLRKMRLLAELTIPEVARIARVKSRKTIMNWETDKSTPDVNQCLAIVDACGWSIEDFIMFISVPLTEQCKHSHKETTSAKQ